MPIDSSFLVARDGMRLYYRYWIPEKPKKILCIIHGHGEHSGRYRMMASKLMDDQIAVYCMDMRGHGKSQGKKGHAKNLDLLLSDIEELLKAARVQDLGSPLFLMGHSMGGNLVANYMISNDSREVTGFILSAPWLKLKLEPSAWKVKSGLLVGKIWSSYSTSTGLDPVKISRITSEVEKYVEDPMVHDKISVALYNAITAGSVLALQQADKIKKPGLVYHGTDDGIIDWTASEKFASGNKKIDWKAIEGAYHEPHNDVCREEIYALVSDWIKKH